LDSVSSLLKPNKLSTNLENFVAIRYWNKKLWEPKLRFTKAVRTEQDRTTEGGLWWSIKKITYVDTSGLPIDSVCCWCSSEHILVWQLIQPTLLVMWQRRAKTVIMRKLISEWAVLVFCTNSKHAQCNNKLVISIATVVHLHQITKDFFTYAAFV